MTFDEAYAAYLVLFGPCEGHNEWREGEQDFLCQLPIMSDEVKVILLERYPRVDYESKYDLSNCVWNLFFTLEYRKRYG